MKKYYTIFAIAMLALAFKGYSNYKSYPKYPKTSIVFEEEKDMEELDIFFGDWNPVGRDKPVYDIIKCGHEHKNNYTGTKYNDMEMTNSEKAKRKK